MNNKTTDSFAAQIRLSVAVVLMRDINQKASDTDKQIAIAPSAAPKVIALRRAIWLSYLLSLGAISTGGLSILAVAALLGTKPAQANTTKPPAQEPNQRVEAEQASPNSSQSSDLNAQAGFHPVLATGESNEKALADAKAIADISSNPPTSESVNLKAPDAVAQGRAFDAARGALTRQVDTSSSVFVAQSGFPALSKKEEAAPPSTGEAAKMIPIANSLSFASDGTATQNPNEEAQASPETRATALPGFVPPPTELSSTPNAVEPQVPQPPSTKTEQPTTILPEVRAGATAFSSTQDGVEYKVLQPSAQGVQPTTILPTFALRDASAPTSNAVEPSIPKPVAQGAQPTTILPSFALRDTPAPIPSAVQPSVQKTVAGVAQPTIVAQATTPEATAATSEPYKGPGGAAMLGGTIQAQSSVDAAQEAQSENALRTNNPLAPSLIFQGGFITQDETGARARVTGLYPVSPNLLFGGTVDLTTGEGFSDTPGTGLDITELYFTTSLPSYPNLRLTGGLVDLTSYFDRNSFAKDSLTHFFNPVFQTNPALARTGIASRPAVLLNWDITDNFQARAAAFSSSRNLGELAVDGFAGELAYRFDNGIIRATYATDRDDQRSGFNEIYGIRRRDGTFGPRTSDRESSYGINAEYYIPEIKMGLFGRYGHYENTSIGRGGETYSAGLNFLDLFMRDDRLGFGYGRDLSSDSLRRGTGKKVPDVWELFYDFRLTSYLRAGVTLQARDQFSDFVAGFRVKTEFDLLNLGRAFK
ncbi:MAG TPA: hypothetical protein V6C93_08075 [Allocoleopsis sp.]